RYSPGLAAVARDVDAVRRLRAALLLPVPPRQQHLGPVNGLTVDRRVDRDRGPRLRTLDVDGRVRRRVRVNTPRPHLPLEVLTVHGAACGQLPAGLTGVDARDRGPRPARHAVPDHERGLLRP